MVQRPRIPLSTIYNNSQPLLKWAGGKTQLLDELLKHVPSEFGHYYEPFVGGGALFFKLVRLGYDSPGAPWATLSDANVKLMRTYAEVKEDLPSLLPLLFQHQREHSEKLYLRIREELNDLKGSELAAAVIYLNRTCFNGLWRVNKLGKFNCPLDKGTLKGGKRANRTICDQEKLIGASRALEHAVVVHQDFTHALGPPGGPARGDFVYLDPPYFPVSETSNFTNYVAGGFGPELQERLAKRAGELRRKGVTVVASNADLPVVRKLYKSEGFQFRVVQAKRRINSSAEGRGTVGELIIY